MLSKAKHLEILHSVQDDIAVNTYLLAKSLHIISFTAWMAGMFYLPRLFAYHASAPVGGEVSEQFKIMERRLLRIIINPAMIFTFGFGIWLAVMTQAWEMGWFHAKVTFVLLLAGCHGFLSKTRRRFAADERPRTARFYKIFNEMITLAFMAIVLLAVLKPF